MPNFRETPQFRRRRKQLLESGKRYEFQKSMFGNVHTIKDHKRKLYYRQDRDITEQLSLLDEPLPRYCDYCKSDCESITLMEYTLVYEMIVRRLRDPKVNRDKQKVFYASCDDCLSVVDNKIPDEFKKGYLVEIWLNNKRIWKSGFLHCDGKLRKPWGVIA